MRRKTASRDVKQVKNFIKKELKALVEADRRLHIAKLNRNKITEYTLQAIIWDHLSQFVEGSWMLSIEDFVPTFKNKKADIVLCKLTRDGRPDLHSGTIAIEVKPNGQQKGLFGDLKKLSQYIGRQRSPINLGVLMYLSPLDLYEKDLRKRAKSLCGRKIEVIRLDPRGS